MRVTHDHRPTFRFAPSPNGELHLGHAYSALLNFEAARRHGGRFLLRIEDIDRTRSRPELVAGVFDVLGWLGLTWEQPVRLQSEHFSDYRAAADRLQAAGLLYPCFASRAEIEAAVSGSDRTDPDGAALYPGIWRDADPALVAARTATGEPFAMRLHMERAAGGWRQLRRGETCLALLQHGNPSEGETSLAATPLAAGQNHLASAPLDVDLTYLRFDAEDLSKSHTIVCHPRRWGDCIIMRKETPTSYHLSVVVDDALQGVTHVIRGQDLEPSTDVHVLLQALLSLPTPAYHHHRLIIGPDGEKLSKRLASTSLSQLRAEGAIPADIRRLVGLR